MLDRLRNIGPGAVVAAAFIGPGTITTATIAGSSFGYTLLWAVLFSVVATLILQEMAARLGVISQNGIGHALRLKIKNPLIKLLMAILVISAILIGNAAYEAGNLTGAVLGLHSMEQWPLNPWVLLIAIAAFVLLYSGKYKLIERFLIGLVAIMGLVFLVSALSLKPNLLLVLKGIFTPRLPDGSLIMIVSLIGTTVVPYNLFLHASAVKNRWTPDELHLSKLDTLVSVVGGGIITMAILITAAAAFEGSNVEVRNISDLSQQLSPVLGNLATGFLAGGFLAAGLSSAITAPLAAAFASMEVMGWDPNLKSFKFRFVWGLVLFTGVIFSSLGFEPTVVILFAQFTNGLLLPVIAIFLLWIMNDKQIMGIYVNNKAANIWGFIVIIVTIILGAKSILTVIGYF